METIYTYKLLADKLLGTINTLLYLIVGRGVKLQTKWKKANVVPIHKRDDKRNVKNYRPVSLFQFSEKYLSVLYTMKCTHFL